jgi:hypothetical protein
MTIKGRRFDVFCATSLRVTIREILKKNRDDVQKSYLIISHLRSRHYKVRRQPTEGSSLIPIKTNHKY